MIEFVQLEPPLLQRAYV